MKFFEEKDHAKSIFDAWLLLAHDRAYDPRVRNMPFEFSAVNKSLLRHLKYLIAEQKNEIPDSVFKELQLILMVHRAEYQEDKSPHKLFDKLANPVPVIDYSKNPSMVKHLDPASEEMVTPAIMSGYS